LDDLPCAMYLRSGDIIMMSRDARLAYHAVPRILRHQELATLLTQDIECDISSERRRSLQCLEKYLSNSRINVNIRQVEGPSGSFAGQVK
jgi:alkylated DNA repair protein alkB family protein 1